MGGTGLAWSMSVLAPLSVAATDLVGRVVPPYPAGLDELGGSCVSDSTDPARVCDYSVGVLASPARDAGGDGEQARQRPDPAVAATAQARAHQPLMRGQRQGKQAGQPCGGRLFAAT